MVERKDVLYVANLARLRLSESEAEVFTGQLNAILEYARQLESVDTSGVEPPAFVSPPHDPVRDDVVTGSLPVEKAVANGPLVKKNFFAIPKVVKQ